MQTLIISPSLHTFTCNQNYLLILTKTLGSAIKFVNGGSIFFFLHTEICIQIIGPRQLLILQLCSYLVHFIVTKLRRSRIKFSFLNDYCQNIHLKLWMFCLFIIYKTQSHHILDITYSLFHNNNYGTIHFRVIQ